MTDPDVPEDENEDETPEDDEMGDEGGKTARGGPIKPGKLYRVGEEGEEWFVPLATKRFATLEVKESDPAGTGSFEAVLSKPSIDRDGEVIAKGAFTPLPKSIPIHTDHVMSSDGLVGTGRPYYDGDTLKVAGTFASTDRAQTIRSLVAEGHLSSMSVGFMAAEYEKETKVPTIAKAELLEASFVTVPSNRDALVLAAKGTKLGARNSKADVERIQAAHDLLADLGASCDGYEKSAPCGCGKTTTTDPEDAAADKAAALPPADVGVARALTDLALVEADLALE